MKIFIIAGVLALCPPVPAIASDWEFLNIEGSGVGTLNACAASAVFRDGFVIVRLYDDVMDMVFQREDFAMPYGTELGAVSVYIDAYPHLGFASTFQRDSEDADPTTSTMQIILNPDKYADLFDHLRNGKNLIFEFPSGDAYTIPLRGSAEALNRASDCWREKETGQDQKNPFEQRPDSDTGSPPEMENAPALIVRNPFEKKA